MVSQGCLNCSEESDPAEISKRPSSLSGVPASAPDTAEPSIYLATFKLAIAHRLQLMESALLNLSGAVSHDLSRLADPDPRVAVYSAQSKFAGLQRPSQVLRP